MNEEISVIQDRFKKGEMSRRDFLRYATVLGLSLGSAQALLAACTSKDEEDEVKTLIFARGGDIQSLDPAFAFDGESARTLTLMSEPLIRCAPGSDGDLQPALAEDWSISDDGLTYTFKLRKDVKFHDGTPFNAEAVNSNYDRQLPGNALPRMQRAEHLFGNVDRIETPDDHTVKIILKEPRGAFGIQLAGFSMCIVSPKALETHGEDYTAHPSGTGPYIFETWDRDAQYVVKANPDYWGPKPKCDRAILTVVKEAPVRVDQLLAGEADVITGIAPADVPRLEDDPNVEIVTAPAINFACLGFLMFKEPFNDVRLRQAVNYAIDRNTSVKFLYGDYGIPLQTCLPKANWAFNDKIEGYPYNPDKAKQLLGEAGHPDGFSFEALTFTQQRPYCPLGMTKVAEIIQADLRKVGIQMNLRPMPGVGETEDAAARSEGDAYFTGYYFTGDPGPIFNSIWHTNSSAPDGGNLPRYSNPEVDDLIEQALPESDQEKRKQIYWKIQEMIIADAPAVFINSYAMMRGVRSNVKNFKIQPDNNDHLWLVDKV